MLCTTSSLRRKDSSMQNSVGRCLDLGQSLHFSLLLPFFPHMIAFSPLFSARTPPFRLLLYYTLWLASCCHACLPRDGSSPARCAPHHRVPGTQANAPARLGSSLTLRSAVRSQPIYSLLCLCTPFEEVSSRRSCGPTPRWVGARRSAGRRACTFTFVDEGHWWES